MPYDRLDSDVKMMKEAGINVVRIAESTWATLEPQEGTFDFSHIDRVLAAMDKAGIRVIIGTPTYAVPAWMVKKHPDILATTPQGQYKFGPRQNMDITHPWFRQRAEIVIRKLMEHVKDHPAVIGFQVDNETKHYDTSGPAVQAQFVAYLQKTYPDLQAFNKEFGMDYWSHRIHSWDDFLSVDGTVNASLAAEFARFQRQLVTDYLNWQVELVKSYSRADQFVTQNFDLDWRGYSYGIQPRVDQFAAAQKMDVAGVDIYHPTQDQLTGTEIAFGGDLTRSMKGGQNYLVIETQAQGFPEWTPYPGQLRQQAFSHVASGANMVSYWHWSTTANSIETYWRGLLSQDFQPNETYLEAKTIGADFARLSPQLVNLKKENKVALYFSNQALTAFNAFKFGWTSQEEYNDVLRPFYNALYRMNVETDLVDSSSRDLNRYALIVVPALYSASDAELQRLNDYVRQGGHIVYTFKSGFSNEHVKVRATPQPGIIEQAAGIRYSQVTIPHNVALRDNPYGVTPEENQARWWMELIKPTTARVLARYDHPVWGQYAALTRNQYGSGTVTYLGFMPSDTLIGAILADEVKQAGLWDKAQALHFPHIVRQGVNQQGKTVRFLFNYSSTPTSLSWPWPDGKELLSNQNVKSNQMLSLPAWGVLIIEAL
ncbi:cellulase family glycosylhydrolase [Affinibrenneria salicis]|uniref:Beta-galactosidase n=2 Tax=Affinibrenneria salicis TaxID=2590031 RepID=A0A5J5G3U1_9GAMM|nr:cellulase family glycosylhydrolase [Affinibrenneria salicis]